MRRFFLLLWGMAFLFSSALPSDAQDKIRVEGMATIHNKRVDIARDKAIDQAQRNAVERAAGVMISSHTEVENFQVKMDRILSESKGFINSYKILKEGRSGDLYQVTIEANVGTGRLKDRMKAVHLIIARKSKPRVMIIFSEQAQKDAIAEAVMARYFMAQGFQLIDGGSVKSNREKKVLRSPTIENRQMADVAQRYGAEVLILGRVEATGRSFKMGEVEVQSSDIAVSVKVVNGDTGEILATGSKTGRGELKTATEEAATELAKQMKGEILERWSSELTNAVMVKVIVSGLNTFQDLSNFKEKLAVEIRGFKEMFQRSFRRGEVELDIEVRGNAQGVADDLTAVRLNRKKVKIQEITANTIKATLSP